ncbi:MAG: hypothetical protein RJA99_2137 [Pseudomonadota bacterium]|jgi:signal transduction histidine kinase
MRPPLPSLAAAALCAASVAVPATAARDPAAATVTAAAAASDTTASGPPTSARPPWRIALLLGSDPGLLAMQQTDAALRATLLAAAPDGVVFVTDTLDTYRFDYRVLAPEFLALQRRKYANQPVDLLIGLGERAVDAVRAQREGLWPGVPVVLAGIDEAGAERGRPPDGAVQAFWRPDVDGTLALIERLQPRARRLIVAGGAAPIDAELADRVVALARQRGGWAVERWTDLPLDALRRRLEDTGPDDAVFLTSMNRDAAGRPVFTAEAMRALADASRAPVYGMFGTLVGRGLAAGSVIDFEALGRHAGELAAALLRGEPVPTGTDATRSAIRCVADLGLLARHGLSADALPEGCRTINPPRSLWTEYRGFVLTAGGVVAAQALTIGGLLVQRRRRRRAEADAGQRRLELARAMRFAAMGELTASIAHEINQPLGAILANADAAELMLRGGCATPEALREILADIRRDDLRAHEVIRRLRGLLENQQVAHEPVGLHAALREALAIVEPEARRRGVTLETALEAGDDALLGDPVQLQQVLINLAINAMDAMDDTPAAARRLSVATSADAAGLVLTVADRGTGVDPARCESAFESFWTTKPRGLGLGLPIVRAIVDAHGGAVSLAPREGGGTVATVRLPRRVSPRTVRAAHAPDRRTPP